ncbi:TPA: hypothetical protein EYM82_11230 [Candidatus Poribacteria bacterium]|nr:hypothetical protein [Candidatus Poribacteria bacterium]
MAIKKLVYGTNTVVLALVILGIVLAVNFLSKRFFNRLDLTENKMYTISKSTKTKLKELDDVVRIEAYFSKSPVQVSRIREEVKDMLDEYDAYGSGNLKIDFLPMGDDEDFKQKLRFMGIPEVQVNVREKDKIEVANVYMGIAIFYEDKKEVIPVIQNTSSLEYDLTSAIIKLTNKETSTIGFLSGHDEFDINAQNSAQFRQELAKQYEIQKVEIKDGAPIDEKISTLVVAGPKSIIGEREKYEIDQFIMRGGKAVFLIDPINMPPGTIQANPLSTGLNDLLSHHGVELGNNLVADYASHDNLTYSQGGFMTVTRPYPYFPKVLKEYKFLTGETSEGLAADHIITGKLDSLTLPWTSSLKIRISADNQQVKADILAQTSKGASTVQSPYDLNPGGQQFRPPSSSRNSFIVAAILSGEFKSFYNGKDIPPVVDDAIADEESDDSSRETKSESEPTKIVVVGTSQILNQVSPAGMAFFQNTLDYLALGGQLIGIRSQKLSDRSFQTEPGGATRLLIKLICIGLVPTLVAIIGVMRFLLKRRARQMIESFGRV